MHGQPDLALEQLHAAAETFPDELVAIVALMNHHRRFGAAEDEVTRLREMLIQRLADSESAIPTGTLEYLVRSPDAGPEELTLILEVARKRLGKTEEYVDALRAVSVLQQRLGRHDEARETLHQMLEIRPSAELHWRCLVQDRAQDRWEEASDHLRQLVKSNPDSPFFLMSYIEALGKTGENEELVQQLELLDEGWNDVVDSRLKSTLQSLLMQVAWDLRDAGHDARAEAILRRILAIDPDNGTARKIILYLYSSDEERLAHESALEKKWQKETDPTRLLENGAKLLASGNIDAAFPLLERSARQLSGSEFAHFNLGLAAVRLERWATAERALGRSIELNPDRAEAYLNRGLALSYLERHADAIVLLERALEMQPDLTQSHFYLYVCYRGLGDQTVALEHLALYDASVGANQP